MNYLALRIQQQPYKRATSTNSNLHTQPSLWVNTFLELSIQQKLYKQVSRLYETATTHNSNSRCSTFTLGKHLSGVKVIEGCSEAHLMEGTKGGRQACKTQEQRRHIVATLTLGNQFPGVKDTEATIRERHDLI